MLGDLPPVSYRCSVHRFRAQGSGTSPSFDGRELELMSMRPEEDVVLTQQDLRPDTQSVLRPDDKALGILIETRFELDLSAE